MVIIREKMRELEAEELIRGLKEKGITNAAVLQAIQQVPREVFVLGGLEDWAYVDTPLPIVCNQTISQPLIVAEMTQMLNLEPPMKVLEIGTGSGYQAAILSHLCKQVYSIERISELVTYAKNNLKRLGIKNVLVKHGDGNMGWPEYAEFDRIIITAGTKAAPKALLDQLAVGGIMVLPVRNAKNGHEYLTKIFRIRKDEYETQTSTLVRFVPLLSGIA